MTMGFWTRILMESWLLKKVDLAPFSFVQQRLLLIHIFINMSRMRFLSIWLIGHYNFRT